MVQVLAVVVPCLAFLALIGLVVMHMIDRHHQVEDLYDHSDPVDPAEYDLDKFEEE